MNKLDLSKNSDRIFGKMLKQQAEQAGNTPFLVNDSVSITFAQAELITNCLATGLAAQGVGAGDRVALLIGNRPEMVLLSLAVNKLSAIWIPINTDYKGEWLLDTLERSRPSLLVIDGEFQHLVAEIEGKLTVKQRVLIGDVETSSLSDITSYQQLLDNDPMVVDYSKMAYSDTCAILWTSGTTGKSKGVMQSYNAWIRSIVDGSSKLYDSQEGDIIYSVLPLFNSGAWVTNIYRSLIEGIPCVIEEKFSVSQFWDRVKKFKATQTFVIGAMGIFLMNTPEKPSDKDNTLKTAGIVPLPPHLWGPFEDRFGIRLIRTGLGMSECLLVINQTDPDSDVPVYALGFAPDDLDLDLFDEKGQPVADGESGEICIKPLAEHLIFNGYFDNPEATETSYRDGWFMTGDMARKDPESGAYFYVDRKKDAVRYAGRNISTLEVESVFRRHPAVEDVAAFGIPSEELPSEDELKVNVVLKADQTASAEELCAFVNENAPHYFVPRYLDFVNSLPYTPTNKVQKFKLREQGVSADCWDLKKSNYKVNR